MNKIKPCPFCGGQAKYHKQYDSIWCETCPGGVNDCYISEEQLIVAWNTRHLTSRSSRAAEACPFCDCVAIDEMGHCEGCGKLTRPPPA